jgi:hypothetical protein
MLAAASAVAGGVVAAALVLLVVGLFGGLNHASQSAAASASGVSAPAEASEKVQPVMPVGYVQTSGTPDDRYVRSYRCAAGYQPVDMPIGKKTELDGTSISVVAKMAGPESYDDQISVTVHAKLGLHQSLAAVIINTGAHNRAPDLYPQSVITPTVAPGGTVDFTLATAAYAENYSHEGITNITFCLN